ncbi:MAG: general secretion pathway protein GspM [Proteobacteria bacterium]|nr:general secretion pathway protein GspM [Pseudomonadota bacterium]
MNAWTQRALLTALICLLAVAGTAAWGYRALWSHYDGAQSLLQSRSERLDGVISVGPEIETTLTALRDNLQPWLRAGGEAAQNDTQQRLRELISASGSTLISSQVALEPAAEGKLAAVRLTATVAGDWTALAQLMQTLHGNMPPLWVRAASFQRDGSNTGAQGQKARITLQLEAPLVPEKAQP